MEYVSPSLNSNYSMFIIGSEFAQLTKIKDEQGNYPAVIELVKLTKRIKLDLGKEVTVTYAADWSEYHSYDGWYNMDELWSSQYIDVVGIDAYFPLTDVQEPPFGYSAEDVMGGWNSGVWYGAPRSAWRTVGENPTQTKSSQQFGTDHYVA